MRPDELEHLYLTSFSSPGRPGAYPTGKVLHAALLVYIRLGQKGLSRPNVTALASSSVTKKGFIVLTIGINVIKLFSL